MIRVIFCLLLGVSLTGCMMTAQPISVSPTALNGVETADVEFRIPADYDGRALTMVNIVEIKLAHGRQGCPDIRSISSRSPGFVGEMTLAPKQPSQTGKVPAGEPLYFYLNYKDLGLMDSARCATGFRYQFLPGRQYIVDVRVSSGYGAPSCASMVSEVVDGKPQPLRDVMYARLEEESGFFSSPSFGKNLCR